MEPRLLLILSAATASVTMKIHYAATLSKIVGLSFNIVKSLKP